MPLLWDKDKQCIPRSDTTERCVYLVGASHNPYERNSRPTVTFIDKDCMHVAGVPYVTNQNSLQSKTIEVSWLQVKDTNLLFLC